MTLTIDKENAHVARCIETVDLRIPIEKAFDYLADSSRSHGRRIPESDEPNRKRARIARKVRVDHPKQGVAS